jgi:hypothetical protein
MILNICTVFLLVTQAVDIHSKHSNKNLCALCGDFDPLLYTIPTSPFSEKDQRRSPAGI